MLESCHESTPDQATSGHAACKNEHPTSKGSAAPGEHLAAVKCINEALIGVAVVPKAVHEVAGHVDTGDGEACPAPHCRMDDGQADGDPLPCRQHMLQQRVLRAVVPLTVPLHAKSCLTNQQSQSIWHGHDQRRQG